MTTTSGTINVYHIHQDWKRRDKANGVLSHRLSVNVNGTPRDMCTLYSNYRSGADAMQNDEVMITFDKGKIVIVVYDVHFNSLKLINMVNTEEGAIGETAFVAASEIGSSRLVHPGVGETPFISVTDDSTLGCINLYAYKLFFIPHQHHKVDLSNRSNSGAKDAFLMDISSLHLPGAILDKCFLSGYNRPALAVLQDNGALPIGHAATVLHTCSVTVLAVDVAMQRCVVLWRQEDLPHDSVRLLPLDPSVARGAVLLIANNAVLVVTQESVHGLACNGFAKTTVADAIPLVPWPLKGGVVLHASRWHKLPSSSPSHPSHATQREDNSTSYVASLADGSLLVFRLEAVGGESISGGNIQYEVEAIAHTVQSTCLAVLPAGPAVPDSDRDEDEAWRYLWFVGSSTSDCLVFDVTVTSFVSGPATRLFSTMTGWGLGGGSDAGPSSLMSPLGNLPSAKKRRLSKTPSLTVGGLAGDGDGEGAILSSLPAELAAAVADEEAYLYSPGQMAKPILSTDPSAGNVTDALVSNEQAASLPEESPQKSQPPPRSESATPSENMATEAEAPQELSISDDDIKRMKVDELKAALAERDASTAGLKAVLCQRLLDLVALERAAASNPSACAAAVGESTDAMEQEEVNAAVHANKIVSQDDCPQPVVPDLSLPGSVADSAATSSATLQPVSMLSEWRRRSLRCRLGLVDQIDVLGPVSSGSLLQSDETICASANIMWDRDDGPAKNLSSQLSSAGHDANLKYASIPHSAASYIVERERKDALQLCTGFDSGGCLTRVSRGLRLAKVASRNFADISGVCSLFCANKSTLLFLSREGPGVGGPGKSPFGSTVGGTRVICCGERVDASKGIPEVFFEELDPLENSFIIDQPTIAVGALTSSGDVCVQACLNGLRVVRLEMDDASGSGNEHHVHPVALQDCLLEEELDLGGMGGAPNEIMVSVDCCGDGGGWVTALSSTGCVYVLQYDSEDESLSLKYKWTSSANVETSLDTCGDVVPISHGDRIVSVSLFNGRLPLEAASDELLAAVAESVRQATPTDGATGPASKEPLRPQRSGSIDLNHSSDDNNDMFSSVESEEEFLYGKAISPDNWNGSAIGENDEKGACNGHTTGRDSAMDNDSDSGQNSELMEVISDWDETYALLVDRTGRVSFVQLTDFSRGNGNSHSFVPAKVFETPPLGSLPVYLPVSSRQSYTNRPPATDIQPPKRFVVDARLCYLGRHHGGHEDLLSLCLVTVMNTGDVVVYNAIQSPSSLLAHAVVDSCRSEHGGRAASSYHRSSTIRVFRKVDHSECTRKRKNARLASERLRRAARGGKASTHRERETCQSLLVTTPRNDMNDRGVCVLVSGAYPLMVSCVKGLPCLQPLGLPEVPYAGIGAHLSTYFSAGETKGVAVLWREDKLDAEESIARVGARAVTCLSTLGIYKDVTGVVNYPRSSVSVAKTKVGLTTHKSLALSASKTEDKTQQAMLAVPTYLLSCSETSELPFTDDVFTTAQIEAEEGAYVRFFPDLTSFCTPINDLAPPPKLQREEHKLVVMQGRNRVVDSFKLDEGEKVLDICVLYLTTGTVEANEATHTAPVKGKKRVFLAAGTSYNDKHGEDTRGEGRLLFFSLDYAMYQTQSSSEGSALVTESKEGDGEMEGGEGPSAAGEGDSERCGSVNAGRVDTTTTAMNAQFFESITPKLRLLWSGLGPSSVVTQFKDEYLLSTVGSVLYIYQLNHETMELDQIAFIYAQVHTYS